MYEASSRDRLFYGVGRRTDTRWRDTEGRLWVRRTPELYEWDVPPLMLEMFGSPRAEPGDSAGWTYHGHWVGDIPEPPEGPPGGSVARCSGIRLCPMCQADAEAIRAAGATVR